ncbi:MAG TPA: NAD-dependent epimerase/dehydratase family protein [Casimicrobiaceae bacterium]
MYAVAGATGQTGAAIARALREAGERVRVIVRRADAGAAWSDLQCGFAGASLSAPV